MIDKLSDIIVRSMDVESTTIIFMCDEHYIITPIHNNIIFVCNELFIKYLDNIGIPKKIYKKHRNNLIKNIINKMGIKPNQDTIIRIYESTIRFKGRIMEEFTYNEG